MFIYYCYINDDKCKIINNNIIKTIQYFELFQAYIKNRGSSMSKINNQANGAGRINGVHGANGVAKPSHSKANGHNKTKNGHSKKHK